jgi:branched-chain amino acid transport system substrate-binding protein
MKKWVYLVLSLGLLLFFMAPQWQSLDRMGERRFQVLDKPAKETVVGVVWPFADNQDGMDNGLELAKDEINAGHLAGAWPIRLVKRDPGFDWEKNKRISMELSNTPEMCAVLGYYEDSAAIKASVLYETTRLLHIMIGVNANAMTQRYYQYIIRTILPNSSCATALARMSTERNYKKLAIIWSDDAYGVDLAYQYRVAMDGQNAEVAYQSSYPLDRADFRPMVNELKEVGADLIFFAGLEPLAGDFLREARAIGLKTPVMGAFTDSPEMRRRAGPLGLEGAMYFDYYDPRQGGGRNLAFVSNYKARFGRLPDTMAAQAYDAIYLLARAIRQTGSHNPLDLSYAIRFMDPWEGANGFYKFDARGEIIDKPLYLKQFRNGEPEIIMLSRAAIPTKTP